MTLQQYLNLCFLLSRYTFNRLPIPGEIEAKIDHQSTQPQPYSLSPEPEKWREAALATPPSLLLLAASAS